jgi:HEAT repeat protein
MKYDGQISAPDAGQVGTGAAERMARMCFVGWNDACDALERAVEALATDEHPGVRAMAADALGRIAGTEARQALGQALLQETCDWVRERCAVALGDIGDRRDIPVLMDALRFDASGNVSYHAARALAALQDPRIVETLLFDLQHGSVRDRVGSAQGLGWLNEISAVGPLTEAMRTDPYCFLPAMFSLHSVGCEDWEQISAEAVRSWKASGREAELRAASEVALPGKEDLFDYIMSMWEPQQVETASS